jgi:hypothetical protein
MIVWCLKRPMARKPLMHNYIYFETLEVGLEFGFCAFILEEGSPGVAEQGREFGPRIRGSHVDGADGLNPRAGRLGVDEVWSFT